MKGKKPCYTLWEPRGAKWKALINTKDRSYLLRLKTGHRKVMLHKNRPDGLPRGVGSGVAYRTALAAKGPSR